LQDKNETILRTKSDNYEATTFIRFNAYSHMPSLLSYSSIERIDLIQIKGITF